MSDETAEVIASAIKNPEQVVTPPVQDNTPLIERAIALSKQLEENNLKMEAMVKKQELLLNIQMMGGKSDAGISPKEKTKEEIIMEDANRFINAIRGTKKP